MKEPVTSLSITNALYAFVIDNEVQYIGKTSRSIKQRFTGYCSPGSSQLTNIRCNEKIRDAHAQQIEVRILIFIPTSNLNYGDFQINLAAGLEDNLIRKFEPPWNVIAGRKRISEETERERAEEPRVKAIVNPKVQEPVRESVLNTKYSPYYIRLGKAYYNQGFINLGVGASKFLGKDGEPMRLHFDNGFPSIDCRINRTANSHGAVRTAGGYAYLKKWIQKHYQQGDTLTVYIKSPHDLMIK